ncbi:MAG: 4-alpha-glucanotransferase [Dehalococcoidia bacterium]|nr:4-alpha-glucanotransferase [Dehalococcoidia bacterium]
MNPRSNINLLHQLAHLYGVQTVYYDVNHNRHQTSIEALLAVLRSLGAPVATIQDVPAAWREQRQALWQQPLEPVTVAWDGGPSIIQVRLPSAIAEVILVSRLILETGEQQSREWHGADLPVVETTEVEGVQYVVKQLLLPDRLAWGYHQLTLELPGRCEEGLIIAAPRKAYTLQKDRAWGVFLPLYALHTQKSWGGGDFSDLEALMTWSAGIGGGVVATLPFLATFLDDIFEPCPYLPASRLLWNEFYLYITEVPELQKCPSAQALLASTSLRDEIEVLRNSSLVDYRSQIALKRRALKELCCCFFAEASDRAEAFWRFAEANPVVKDYARFRATCEKQRIACPSWPERLRDGVLTEGDYDEESKRYHLYVQWLAYQQIHTLSEKAREKGLRLYLDLPLGIHPYGYDVWRERAIFALDVSAGAPPDAVFSKGQNWRFPPLHPEKIRQQGYRYIINYTRHHLQHAGFLRIDHVMGLHRLLWIPNGLEASQGVYVRYRSEELYAILALESHRHGSIIVGEDLGTVPPEVRPAMARHGLHRMYVVQYELTSSPQKALRPVFSNCVASLNTHDMPPFAAFWQGLDIKDRLDIGLLNKASAREETKTRQATREALVAFLHDKGWLKKPTTDAHTVLNACLAFLSASQAWVVLVNLEDLWLETQPQNVPSTKEEYSNWRHKARYSLEAFCQMPQVVDTLHLIDHLRKQGRHPGDTKQRD